MGIREMINRYDKVLIRIATVVIVIMAVFIIGELFNGGGSAAFGH